MSGPLVVTVEGPVLTVVIDRPKANAIDAATSRLLGETFARFRDDPVLRVAILTGAGERFFSAGWDLAAAVAGEAPDSDYGVGGFGGIARLPGLNKPVIGAVNGMAVGGGFELALCCDLVVAAGHARFWLPETRVGVIPDAATLRLPRRLPRARAIELLLTGRQLTAAEAVSWGLVNRVVEPADLLAEAMGIARGIIEGAPLAVAAVLEVARATEGLKLADAYALLEDGDLSAYRAMLGSEDAIEGPTAFAEKRLPIWRGR
ncbi:MAG TPA: enoyl-CoA hydratase-related protein [Geminicoccus sp.]|uniref:enoyl-CoA hydratase-related protein n=1 Tax=Geminicoccus sp. TaxID=2024832 RepID=UPI002C72F92F|nr:enoyl-CoA hydratase-related protein [Geminicoccus sp.]HWL71006.1 enoyl-CoA hydratase-related protein [Geminicoccus sp.]